MGVRRKYEEHFSGLTYQDRRTEKKEQVGAIHGVLRLGDEQWAELEKCLTNPPSPTEKFKSELAMFQALGKKRGA
jgi:uncharacterized protein (DUF1778 family)